MTVTKYVTLFGDQVAPELPIDYATERITGIDARDVAGSLIVQHRALKASWTLRFTLLDEAETDALIALGAQTADGDYIGEEGVTRRVIVRGVRKLLTHVNQATSEPTYTVEIDLEDV